MVGNVDVTGDYKMLAINEDSQEYPMHPLCSWVPEEALTASHPELISHYWLSMSNMTGVVKVEVVDADEGSFHDTSSNMKQDVHSPALKMEIKKDPEQRSDNHVLHFNGFNQNWNGGGQFFQSGFSIIHHIDSVHDIDRNDTYAGPSTLTDTPLHFSTIDFASLHPRNSLQVYGSDKTPEISDNRLKLAAVNELWQTHGNEKSSRGKWFSDKVNNSYSLSGIICNRCGRHFRLVAELKEHKLSCRGDKPCKCEICGKTFTLNANLKTHQRIHTGEKHYKCDICGEQFIYNYHLKNHKSIHTGENPYRCDKCGKQFSQSSNLKKHLITHTGEKHYKCGLCGRHFSQSSNLKKHLIIHTGEKPHQCDKCGKEFAYNCNLKVHRISCSGGKLCACIACGKKFISLSKLNTHLAYSSCKHPPAYPPRHDDGKINTHELVPRGMMVKEAM